MKLSLCLFSTLLWFNTCLSESLDNRVPRDKLKITDLNLDVQHLILEQLDFADLLNVTDTNSSLSTVAVDVFQRRHYEVFVESVDAGRTYDIKEDGKCVSILNFDIILRTLKQFAGAIQHLTIRSSGLPTVSNDEKTKIANHLNNGRSYDSLKYLELGFADNNSFGQFDLLFPEVEELLFFFVGNGVSSQSLSLNQFFPKLRRLSVGVDPDVDHSYLDHHFPTLEHLQLQATKYGWNQHNLIGATLEKNLQIRSIEIDIHPFDYAVMVRRYLPNVENLTISSIWLKGDPVHFEHVKNFRIKTSQVESLGRLFFNHLESLVINYSSEYFDTWLQFFKRNSNLSRLSIECFGTGVYKFIELTNELPNLIEMSISAHKLIETADVVQFIENHPKLIKLNCVLGIYGNEEDVLESLRDQFENEWLIQRKRKNGHNVIVLEKKNIDPMAYD